MDNQIALQNGYMTLEELKGWHGKPIFLEDNEDSVYGNRWFILEDVFPIDRKEGFYCIVFTSNEVYEWNSNSYTNANTRFRRPVGINDCAHYCDNWV